MIFDYGNVLSAPQSLEHVENMARVFDLPPERFKELYWQFRIPYDAAILTPEDYWNTVARAASRTIAADEISRVTKADNYSWSHPARAVGGWAGQLRAAGLKTAILSNMPVPVRDYVLGRPWLPDFDVRVFSCEIGVCKPALEIYHECIAKLGTAPSEILFLDDREANVRAAEALGLHAIRFTELRAAAAEIDRRFSFPVTLSNLIA